MKVRQMTAITTLSILSTTLCAETFNLPQNINLVEPYRQAVEAMQLGQTDQAQPILEQLIQQYGRDAVVTIGPAFGNIWYHYGLCRLAANDFSSAIHTFKTCYLRFPNPDGVGTPANAYHFLALLRWAETEQQREHYLTAIKLYAKALRSKKGIDLRDKMGLNLSLCLYEVGDTKRAEKLCNLLINRRSIAPAIRRMAILQHCRIAVERGDVERVRTRIHGTQEWNEAPTLERAAWVNILLHIGRRCTFLDDPVLALRFYELIPGYRSIVNARNQSTFLSAAGIGPSISDAVPQDFHGELLIAKAAAWYQLEAFRMALSGYERALPFVSPHKRPQVLHAASVSAAMLDLPYRAGRHAQNLLEFHPNYPLLSEVLTAWLESLLRSGQIDEAHALSIMFRQQWTLGKPEREVLDFIAATSAFRRSDFEQAYLEFSSFLLHYPRAQRLGEATYLKGLCQLRRRQWKDALQILSTILKTDMVPEFTDGVLYYRGLCYSLMDDPSAAEADLIRLVDEHPESPHLPVALNLIGDLHFRRANRSQADTAYSQAISAADAMGAPDAAAYATLQRIRIAATAGDYETAVTRYESFRKSYPNSDHLVRATTTIGSAYEALGRANDAIDLLTQDILNRGNHLQDPHLSTLLNAHHSLYKRTFGYKALLDRLRNFPGPSEPPAPLAAWLALGQIETWEGIDEKGHRDHIDELYRLLATQYSLEKLDDIFVLKLARWLQSSGDEESSIAHYTVLIQRHKDSDLQHHARIERSRLYRKRGDVESRNQAIDDLQFVIEECRIPEIIETAHVDLARAFVEAGQWNHALSQWEGYLRHPDWTMARAEATYTAAKCHDHLLQHRQALEQYVNTYVHFEGHVEWSARAFLRAALIVHEKGDQQRAKNILDDMMTRLGHVTHPIVNKARTLQTQWTLDTTETNKS